MHSYRNSVRAATAMASQMMLGLSMQHGLEQRGWLKIVNNVINEL
jgi:hypothetical protein